MNEANGITVLRSTEHGQLEHGASNKDAQEDVSLRVKCVCRSLRGVAHICALYAMYKSGQVLY